MNNSEAPSLTSVDAYIVSFEEPVRARLLAVRALIRKAAPQAQELIAYRMPAYKLNGALVYFAGYARHIGFYAAGKGMQEFAEELKAFPTSKGTIQLPHDRPLPTALLRKMVALRVAQNTEKTDTPKRKPAIKPKAKTVKAKKKAAAKTAVVKPKKVAAAKRSAKKKSA